MLPKILAIVGPTAAGKTELGLRLAKELNGEVIAVDSRTVYRGMDIGTAKPSKGTWGIDLVEPDEDYSIAEFKEYADKKIAEILNRGQVPILVGGTPLWMDAITKNLALPEVPPDTALRHELEARSLSDLYDQYVLLDPHGAEVIDRFNQRRLIRALEVCLKTGRPFSELRRAGEPKYDGLTIGIEVDRDELRRRIDARVDQMIDGGLVDEVRGLKEKYGCEVPAMSGIGYRQICQWLSVGAIHELPLRSIIAEIKTDTWHLAKRQLTWWKRDPSIHWITPISSPEYFSPLRDQLVRPFLSSPSPGKI